MHKGDCAAFLGDGSKSVHSCHDLDLVDPYSGSASTGLHQW